MTFIQRFFMTVLPKNWAGDMQAESKRWRIRCCDCGASKSVWEIGGIRWKAASADKRISVHCSHCGGLRPAIVEFTPADASTKPA